MRNEPICVSGNCSDTIVLSSAVPLDNQKIRAFDLDKPLSRRGPATPASNYVTNFRSWSVDGADQSQTEKDTNFDFRPTDDDFLKAEFELEDA